MDQTAYAVVNKDGTIVIRTVSPTKIGAMVNWLYLVYTKNSGTWTDEIIEKSFSSVSKMHKVTLETVSVSVLVQH